MTAAVGWRPLLPIYLTCLGYGVLAGTGMPLIPLALEHRGVDTITIGHDGDDSSILDDAFIRSITLYPAKLPAELPALTA